LIFCGGSIQNSGRVHSSSDSIVVSEHCGKMVGWSGVIPLRLPPLLHLVRRSLTGYVRELW